jgi:hypothetical protein
MNTLKTVVKLSESLTRVTGMSATSTLSKKRYAEFEARLRTSAAWTAEQVLMELREVMRFDPAEKQYTKEKGAKMMEARRARAASMGISISEMRRRDKIKT